MYTVISFRFGDNNPDTNICLGHEFKDPKDAKEAGDAYKLYRGGKYDVYKIFNSNDMVHFKYKVIHISDLQLFKILEFARKSNETKN
jgi:hypothetical protein